MTAKSTSALTAELLANITDNTNGENTATRVREILQDMIDSLVNNVDVPQPLVFKAYIYQSGSDAPLFGWFDGSTPPAGEVLVNTLGVTPTLNRETAGIYHFTIPGYTFAGGKLNVFITPQPIDNAEYTGNPIYMCYPNIGESDFTIKTFDPANNTLTDGFLYNQVITVEIYP